MVQVKACAIQRCETTCSHAALRDLVLMGVDCMFRPVQIDRPNTRLLSPLCAPPQHMSHLPVPRPKERAPISKEFVTCPMGSTLIYPNPVPNDSYHQLILLEVLALTSYPYIATPQPVPIPYRAKKKQCRFQAPAVPTPNAASPPEESTYVQPGRRQEPATAPDRVQIDAAGKKHQLRGVSSQSTDKTMGAKTNGTRTYVLLLMSFHTPASWVSFACGF